MKHPIIIKCLSILINLLCFVFISVVVLALNNWYQSGDTKAFFFWTLPLALALGIFSSTILYFVKATNLFLSLVALAIVVALIWFCVMGLFWGSVGNPFSFQPFYLWVIGSFAQLLFLHYFLPQQIEKPSIWEVLLQLIAFLVILVVLMYAMVIIVTMVTDSINRRAYKKSYLIKVCNNSTQQCGYVNQDGDTIITEMKYSKCFTDTIRTYGIGVNGDSEMVAIDRQGDILYKVYSFDNAPDEPSDGLFRIIINNKIGYADYATGEIIIEPKYSCAYPFKNGVAQVNMDCRAEFNGEHSLWQSAHWEYINKAGNKTAAPKPIAE